MMPMIKNGTRDIAEVNALTHRLAEEISHAGTNGQPVIYENAIAQTGNFHVTVVWDDWSNLPLQTRSRIILDAYARSDPPKSGKISIAMGLTFREAVDMGLYPFTILANVRRADDASRVRVIQALKNEGALELGNGLQLRFRTLDEAEEALGRLQQEIPGPFWSLVQELRSDA
jgi:hypothetical protein